MDLITFIQASTIKTPSNTTQSNPLKSEGKEFSNLLDQASKSELGENFFDTSEFENLTIEEMETLILNMLEELNIEVDEMTEVDFNVVAQLLIELRGKTLDDGSISLEEMESGVELVQAVRSKGKNEGNVQSFISENKELLPEVDKSFLEVGISESGSTENGKKETFLKELIQLMDKNVDKETLKDFLAKHIPQLKEISTSEPTINLEPMNEIVSDKKEVKPELVSNGKIDVKSEAISVQTNDMIETAVNQTLNEQAKPIEASQQITEDIVKTSIIQSATYNENRINKPTDKAGTELNQNAFVQEDGVILNTATAKPELNQNFSNQNQQQNQPEKLQAQPFISDEVKPMYAEGGFESELSSEMTKSDVKVQFGQVAVDTSLTTKPIEAIAKTESVRYTTPVEFVDQLNGIITKHSKGLDGVEKISIQIYPKELGRIDLDLNLQQQRLSVDFTVSNDRVKEIVETNFVALVDQLDTKGVQVDKLEAKTEKEYQQQKHEEREQKQKPKQNGQNQQENQEQQKRKLGYNTFELTA